MPRAKTIAVCSGSGGVGKTLLATNLAASFMAQDLGAVLLVDASHPMPGDLLTWVGLERAKTLGDMAAVLGRLTAEIFAGYLVRTKNGLPVLPFVADVLQARHVGPAEVAKGLELAATAFDLIVIDAPALSGPLGPAVFDRCDYACVVGEATPDGVNRARHCLDYLRSLQVPADAFSVCFNRAPEDGSVSTERLGRVLGVSIATVLPDDPDVVKRSLATRTPILLGTPRHAIARAVDRLARDLVQRSPAARQ
jgi:MinD-like ATPase involved in chromosome partitioning or flagellar assembly